MRHAAMTVITAATWRTRAAADENGADEDDADKNGEGRD